MRNLLLLALLTTAVVGCGNARSSVTHQEGGYQSGLLRVQPSGSEGLVVSEELRSALITAFEEEVYHARAFQRGAAGVTATYHFLAGDPGSRGMRFFLGFGAGSGTIVVEVVWTAADGHEIARTQHTGVVTGGGMGGTWEEAFVRCGEEMGTFARKNFLEH